MTASLPDLASGRASELVAPTSSKVACMQDRQTKACFATTERTQRPARALHSRHACCRVLDICQGATTSATGPTCCIPFSCQICSSNSADSGAPLHQITRSLTISRIWRLSSRTRCTATNGGASSILNELILVATNTHGRELKLRP